MQFYFLIYYCVFLCLLNYVRVHLSVHSIWRKFENLILKIVFNNASLQNAFFTTCLEVKSKKFHKGWILHTKLEKKIFTVRPPPAKNFFLDNFRGFMDRNIDFSLIRDEFSPAVLIKESKWLYVIISYLSLDNMSAEIFSQVTLKVSKPLVLVNYLNFQTNNYTTVNFIMLFLLLARWISARDTEDWFWGPSTLFSSSIILL